MKLRILLLLCCTLMAASAHAQQSHRFTIKDGKLVGGALPVANAQQAADKPAAVNQEQQWMFSALSAMMQRDYAKAEQLYSQVLRHNSGHAEAYLQRGVARRELAKPQATTQDARMALTLLNRNLTTQPNDADLYYKRSMAFRLLKEFDLAKKDLLTAMQLKGKSGLTYKNDMQAIELERRMAGAVQ